jgi:histidinol-phosphate aminotransferase
VDILNAARSTAIPLSVTAQAAAAAIASLVAEKELLDRVRVIAARRDATWQALIDQGWNIPVPQGNFLWLPTGAETTSITEALSEAGLVVRPFALEGIRISIGEEQAVATLLVMSADLVDALPVGHPARKIG